MFIYAWSSFVFVPWIALAIGITLYIWAAFIMYLAAFSYLADWSVISLRALLLTYEFIYYPPVMGHTHHPL